MIIQGQNLRLKLGEKYVAFAKTCTLHVAANLITYDNATKDDTTFAWEESDIDQMSYDISAEQLFSTDVDTTGMQAEDVLTTMLAGKAVDFEFERTVKQSEKNRAKAATICHGKVIINDTSITGNNKENGSASLQAKGTGELKMGSKAA